MYQESHRYWLLLPIEVLHDRLISKDAVCGGGAMIGRLIGDRYKIIRELGSGGMARVYQAKDNKTFSLVAVKILCPQLSENFTYIQRFGREAKMAMNVFQSAYC